jgi:uncharacterized cupredoxin-like copper-binding protein
MKSPFKIAAMALMLSSHLALAHDETAPPAALGKPGNPARVSRTVKIEMQDTMRFTPSRITVKRGETIRFVVANKGKRKHEMVLGSIRQLKEHAALMLKFPDMEHSEPNQLAVEAGKTGELIWQFTRSAKVDFACLQPGHFEAGMVGTVTVK